MVVANTAEEGPARETRLLLNALEELPTSPPARPQCPPIRAKREVDMIDLTLDTPSKPVSQGREITVESKGRSPLLVLSADILRTAKTHYRPTEDELTFLEHGDPEDTKLRFRSVRFAHDDKMSTGYMRHHHTGIRDVPHASSAPLLTRASRAESSRHPRARNGGSLAGEGNA